MDTITPPAAPGRGPAARATSRAAPSATSSASGPPGPDGSLRKIIVMGAGGRDFHNFNVVFRGDASTRVVAFTATQIPGIAERVYPASLAGPLYPEGIPIRPEQELAELIRRHHVDEVVLSYSDLRHETVMHKASIVLAAGADFRLLGPQATMLRSSKPAVAVCATRTGCGKSQTSRKVGETLMVAGLDVALVRHPMPYGDLEAMRVQRFGTMQDIDASHPTVEEREEYEEPVRMGMVMYAGVDYEAILRSAEQEADVIVWDGGNNDFPFYAPDLLIVVADPLRAGHELRYHPGETNVRMADVVVINKVDSADARSVERVLENVESVNPMAKVVFAKSPPVLEHGPELLGRSVLVVEDGPTLTHGEMPFGAGLVAARNAGAAKIVDPRPYAVGSLREVFAAWPQLTNVLPAMGYSPTQLRELAETIDATPCDVVVTGTPIDLARLIDSAHPIRHVRYALEEVGRPTIAEVLEPIVAQARAAIPRRS
jgi:predicted GTPase